jgi:alpha-beta hydrolase superfamily lysophospholipase
MVGVGGEHLRTLIWEPGGDLSGKVVIVHGLGEHAGRYVHVARHLAGRGFGVLGFDLRGHGESEGRRGVLGSFDELMEDLHLARDVAERRLSGETPPFLYGHSLGALVVIRYLQTYRSRTPGAVLSAPWLRTAVDIPWWKRAAARLLLPVAPDTPLSSSELDPTLLSGDPAVQEAWLRDPLVHHRLSPGSFHEILGAQARALEQGIDPAVPTLVLVPTEDGLTDGRVSMEWARAVKGGHVSVVELDGFRHEPHNDLGREEVLDTIASWLADRGVVRPPGGLGVHGRSPGDG